MLPAAAVTLEDDLVSWWLMGEKGTVIGGETVTTVTGIPDNSGNSVDAEVRGAPELVPGNPFAPYPFEESLAVRTGGSDYLLAPDDASFNFEDEDFSVSLWARADGNGGQWKKLFQRNVGSGFYQAESGNGGHIVWNIRAGGNSEVMTRNVFGVDADWHHLVFLRDTAAGEIRAYVDGELDQTDTNEPAVGSLGGDSALAIGAETNGVNAFEGEIDDVRVYNVALTGDDVLAIYNETNPGEGDFSDPAAPVTREDDIVGWWLMGENATVETVMTPGEVQAYANEVAGAPEAAAQGSPQVVDGYPFDPYFFEQSLATRTSNGNYLLADDDPAYNFADEDFSISLWARSDGNGGQWKKLFQRNVGTGFYQAESGNGGHIVWNIRSGGNSEVMTRNVFGVDADWHHLVFLRDTGAGEIRAYIDGELDQTDTNEPAVGSLAGSAALGIGAENNGVNAFEGEIDDVRIYGVALSDADVLAIYNDGLGDFAPGEPLRLQIDLLPETDELEFRFDSKDGFLYRLRSEADPAKIETDLPETWPVVEDEIEATPPENTLVIARPDDPWRFYVVEEYPAPPVEVFADDFEGGAAGWTAGAAVGDAGGTSWELGEPSNVGPSAAHSPTNCYGTGIAAEYTADTAIWLRSPAIDLTTAGAATLHFAQFKDIEEGFDFGTLRLLDAADDSEIAVLQPSIDGITADWEQVTESLPAEALGKSIVIEFGFTADDISNFPGWYIDDVIVTVP